MNAPLLLLIMSTVKAAEADTSACIPHTDEEYREIILGAWGIDSNPETLKYVSIQFLYNGKFFGNAGLEGGVLGAWSIEKGVITYVVEYNSNSHGKKGIFRGTLLCVGQHTLKIQWAEDDIETLYR